MKVMWWWRAGLLVAGLGTTAWILAQYYGVDGRWEVSYRFNQDPTVISEFSPHGRALDREQNTANGEYYQRVVAEPAYFSVRLPSAYPQIAVTLEYQNPEQALVQLGVRLNDDTEAWAFDFRPLENKYIDDSNWSQLHTADYLLLQRTPDFVSVEDFLLSPPTNQRVGTFLTQFEFPFVDPTYQPSDSSTTITQTLRGRHELYTYIKDETLEFAAQYQDINYAAGPDPLTVRVYRLGKEIYSATQEDDGDSAITGVASAPATAVVSLPNLAAGVYQVVLDGGDDIVFSQITTSQHKVVFKGGLHLAGSNEYSGVIDSLNLEPTTVYTDTHFISLIAKHPHGLATIDFYDRPVVVNKVNTAYIWRNPIPHYFTSVIIPQNDMALTSDGWFALSADSWFDPAFGFEPLSQYTRLDALDYILSAPYQFPERLRSWTTATATFDLTAVQRADPTQVDFILSAPGLDRTPQGLKVRAIHITADKEPVTWKNFWSRLQRKFFDI